MNWTKEPKIVEDTSFDKLLEDFWVIEPVEMQTPDYSYWASQEPLNASYQIRNLNWWWKVKTWFSSISAGTTNITWVWFKPKSIQVVVNTSNRVAWGYADNIWWTLTQRCVYFNWSTYNSQPSRLFRFDWINVWNLISIDNDWFTVSSDLSATMIWTCFW